MRNRFEHQLSIGQRPIEETPISSKSKDALEELLAALKAIYCNEVLRWAVRCVNLYEFYVAQRSA